MSLHLSEAVLDFNSRELRLEQQAWEELRATRLSTLLERGEVALGEADGTSRVRLLGGTTTRFKEDDFIQTAPERAAETLGALLVAGHTHRNEIVAIGGDGDELMLDRPLAAGRHLVCPTEPLEGLFQAVQFHAEAWQGHIGNSPFAAAPTNPTGPLQEWALRPESAFSPRSSTHLDLEEGLGRSSRLPDLLVIQGPPGTGKTSVLARLIARWASQGASVLATAFTNRAVDELLSKVAESSPDTPRHRVGRQRRHRGGLPGDAGGPAAAQLLTAVPGACTGATLYKVNTCSIGDSAPTFDVCVLDEASQVWLGQTLALGRMARHLVVVGDPAQLAPVFRQDRESLPAPLLNAGLHGSVIAHLMARARAGESFFLRESYRMNAPLCELISAAFYQGRLESHPSVRHARWPEGDLGPLSPTPGIAFVKVPRSGPPSTALHAPEEAEAIRKLIEACEARHGTWLDEQEPAACHSGLSPPRYVISCFYRRQVTEVRSALLRSGLPRGRWHVDTVERNQGRTCPVALLSLGVDEPPARHGADFFGAPSRWNVALSRGRYKALIVGRSLELLPPAVRARVLEARELAIGLPSSRGSMK